LFGVGWLPKAEMIIDEKEVPIYRETTRAAGAPTKIKAEIALDIVNSSHRIRSSAPLCIRLQFSARNYAAGCAARNVRKKKVQSGLVKK